MANTCYEGIAVTVGSNPFGPYNVYFLNANYNPSEPGYPYLLNDFAKIATSRDAFLLFYDEFPLNGTRRASAAAFSTEHNNLRLTKNALEAGPGRSRLDMENRTPTSRSPSRTWVSCRHQTEPVLR